MGFWREVDCIFFSRDVTKISSCWVNKTSRHGINQLKISFGSFFPSIDLCHVAAFHLRRFKKLCYAWLASF